MKLMFSTLGCPDWSLDTIIKTGQACGCDGVELRTNADGNHFAPSAPLATARATAQRFRDGGLPVLSIMGYSTFAHLDAAKVKQNVELLTQLVDVAEAFQAPFIRTFIGGLPAGLTPAAAVETVSRALKPVAARAADKGVRIGVETHDDWCAGDRVMAIVKAVDSPGLGVVFDIFNALLAGHEPWRTTYAKVKSHLCYFHLKDGYRGPDGECRYVMLGAGDLPLHDLLACLKADGFAGPLSLEWEKKWHPELEPLERVLPAFVHKARAVWDAA